MILDFGFGFGIGLGSGRKEDRKGLRLRKIGRLERASAQEDRKTGKGFGSGRSKGREMAQLGVNKERRDQKSRDRRPAAES